MSNYSWKPIERLSDIDRTVDLASIQPLYETWTLSKERLQNSSGASLTRFTERLVRRLSVETGILERLYDLDFGTTEALVANGFAEQLISRSSTDIEPSRLIDILKDQEAAIHLVMDCVAGNRPLTKRVVHELHVILTKHQDTTVAVDQFGNHLDIPLLKGRFKDQPNNPKRPDGDIHEYCPPVHVESEIDNLLAWLGESTDVDPIVLTAWFHHRFTQIHPYQDGNGRLARTLTTLILLRADLLPLVIDRNLRTEYVHALEAADLGKLAPLTLLFARLERTAILQALSVDVDAEISHEQTLTTAVINTLAEKFGRRRQAKDAELRAVNDLAVRLRKRTRASLETTLNRLKEPVSQLAQPEIHVADGGPDRGNAHWYKFEVIKSANETRKFANFDEDHYFVKASFRAERERLVFVTSFHHVGRELSGIMESTAFANLESFEQSDDRASVWQDFFICSLEPFVLTYRTDEAEIAESYDRWLDAALAVAIKEYGDRL